MARIKCNRCDRFYSGMHLKCPYCGAHRSKNTVRKEQEEMSNSKLMVGGIILIALIVAVVILIIVSLSGNKPAENDNTTPETPDFTQSEGVDSIDGTAEGDDTEDGTNPEDDQTANEPVIESVSIVLNGTEKTDVSVRVGDKYDFDFETEPATTDEVAIWSSDDENVAVVMQNGEVSAVGSGTTFINVTVGGKTGSMVVRVKG